MSDGPTPIFPFFLVLVAFVAIFSTSIGKDVAWQRNLIDRGLAMYCLDDGAFAFKGECDE